MGQFVKVPGNLAQISVASAADAWGCNLKTAVFQCNSGVGCQQAPWVRMPGKLTQISAGSAGNVWGANSIGSIYQFTGGAWKLKLDYSTLNTQTIGGRSVGGFVSAASDGTVFALIAVETQPAPPPSPAVFTNLVYNLSHGKVKLVSTYDNFGQIAVGSASNVWALGPAVFGGCSLLKFTGKGSFPWQFILPDQLLLVQISASGDAVWGLDQNGNIWEFPGDLTKPWTQIHGNLAQIAVGSNTNVWGLDGPQGGTNHNIYQFSGNKTTGMQQITGASLGGATGFEQISVAPDGTTWALTAAGETFLYQAQTPSGLGGSANYILGDSNCQVLKDVQVTIEITTDLFTKNVSGPNKGFAFQLNANSKANQNANKNTWIVWQQYIIGVGPGISGAVNNWTVPALKSGNQTINSPAIRLVKKLSTRNKIPKGFKLTFILKNDKAGNVESVTFVVDRGKNKKTITKTQVLKKVPGVTSAELAPIVAFELNLVGPGDLASAKFLSGAGKITYSSSTTLTAQNAIPPCAGSSTTTGETSNSVYGALPASASETFTQCFSVGKVNR